MFTTLTSGITKALQKVFGAQKLTEGNIDEALLEVRTALLAADVHYKVVRALIDKVRSECVGQKVLQGVSPAQQVIKIIHDELAAVLGSELPALSTERPLKILLCGLQGSGKTTTAAKLGLSFKKQGLRVTLVACDLQRPAAIDQLEVLSKQAGVGFFKDSSARNPAQVAKEALSQEAASDVYIFDTAGRLQIDSALMDQLSDIQKSVLPQERWLVIDSALGQQSVDVASSFKDTVNLNGLILAKFDGDARGGAALSIRSLTQIPVRYVGSGEKIEDLDLFYPQRIAGRIMGMGDVVGLVEHAQSKVNQEEAQQLTERMMAADFSLDDLLKQFQQVNKMGDMGKLVSMIPGMSGVSVGDQEKKKMARSEAIILSMTPRERHNPQLITGSRLLRIAKGSGVMLKDVNALLKQFNQMRDMMRQMKGSKGKEMMKRMEAMKNNS